MLSRQQTPISLFYASLTGDEPIRRLGPPWFYMRKPWWISGPNSRPYRRSWHSIANKISAFLPHRRSRATASCCCTSCLRSIPPSRSIFWIRDTTSQRLCYSVMVWPNASTWKCTSCVRRSIASNNATAWVGSCLPQIPIIVVIWTRYCRWTRFSCPMMCG